MGTKITFVIYGVLIVVLFVWTYLQSRAISSLNAKVLALTTPVPKPADSNSTTEKTSDNGGNWMEELQGKLKKVDIEFTT